LEYSNTGTENKDAGVNTLEIFGTERFIKFQLSNSLDKERERHREREREREREMRKRRRTQEPPTNTREQMGSKRIKSWFLVPQISHVLSCAKAILRS
jgi:hypothetical protein